MPGGKGDRWIRGLLAQSVEQLQKKSGTVEDARTARQREQDRLARLRGEVSGQGADPRAQRQSERLVRVSGRDSDSEQKEEERLATNLSEGVSQDQGVGERTRLRENEKRGQLNSSAVGRVNRNEGVGVVNIEVSAQQKRKKLELSKSDGEEQTVEDDREEVVFIAIKEKQTLPVEVIDIEDPSDEEEISLKKKKKKKEKSKKRKRKQENEARFYKNPLFDLSNGNVPDITEQKDPLVEADPSLDRSVVSMGTRFETECEGSLKSNQVENLSEANSNRSSSSPRLFSSSASTNSGKTDDGAVSTQESISKAGLMSMKKTYGAGGRKRIFTQEEDAVILGALQSEGGEVDFPSLAKDLGRSYASVRGRLHKLQAGDTKKRHMAFALSEDMAIMDMVLPYVGQVLEGRVPNWEWLRMAEEMGQRRCQSLRSRWEHYLKPWLLQHQAGTLNLSINNLLLTHLVSSYSSIDAILWSEVAKMKEFVGHTESSLRSLFYSKLYKNAQNTLGKERGLVTLKDVAEVEEARVEEERITKGVKERQEEVIKYWSNRKKMTLVDSLLQEEKKYLLAQKVGKRKEETLKEAQSQGGMVRKQVNLVKKKQKKGRGEKKQFESLPRLDHKHNKPLARDLDTYNLDQPILAQV